MKSFLGIVLLVLTGHIIYGQDPHFRKYTLPSEYNEVHINIVLQAKDHFIWLGTSKGLFQFDGKQYKHFIQDTTGDADVTALFEDSEGILWIGHESGKIEKIKNNEFMEFIPKEGFPSVRITGFAEDINNNIWFSTYGEGAYLLYGSRMYNINTDDGLNDNFSYTIAADKNGQIWIGTDGGIAICSFDGEKKITKIDDTKGLPDNIVTAILSDSSAMWIGMESGGVCKYDVATGKIVMVSRDWQFGRVTALQITNQVLWAGTSQNGLVELNILDEASSGRKLQSDFSRVSSIEKDSEGNIWIADKTSSLYFTGRLFSFVKNAGGKQIKNVQALLFDSKNRIWYSTESALFSFEIENPESIKNKTSLFGKEPHIISMYEDKNGNLWFGTFNKGVYFYNPTTDDVINITEKNGLGNNNVLSITGYGEDIWFATLGGVSRCNLGEGDTFSFTNFSSQNGLGSNYIYQVFADSNGRIWFATDGEGVTMLEDSKFYTYTQDHGLGSDVIYSITEDTKGEIWISTSDDGIYKYDNNEFKAYKPYNKIKNLGITSLVSDKHGNLIIVSRQGIDVLNLESHSLLFHGAEVGIENLDPNLNAYAVDNKGNIWFGGQNGIIKYFPENNQPKPFTKINQVEVFLHPIVKNKKEFAYDENHISFDYKGFWYHNPEEVVYLLKLEGYDMDWLKSKNDFITYSSLPPGEYDFMVKASATGYFDDVEPQIFSFIIKPPFYSTWWFYTLVSLSLFTLLALFIKKREEKLREEERKEKEMIEFKFETLKSQVNPHFLFNSFNTLLAVIDDDKDAALEYVEKLSDFYRNILVYREKDVISLREEIEMVETYLFLQRKRYKDNFTVEFLMENHFLAWSIAPMALQLLLENAIKHNIISKDRPLNVKIYIDHEYLVVINNIQLRKSQEPSTGTGLANIIHRYRLLTPREVIVLKNENEFIVKLPLLP